MPAQRPTGRTGPRRAAGRERGLVKRRMSFARRHGQLLDLAEELFVRDGYAAVTMEEIARAAGVTRPVVYDHLESKEAAYLACVERARAGYQGELLAAIAREPEPRARLRAGAEVFFGLLERDPRRWQLLFGSNAVLPGETGERLAEMHFATVEELHRLFRAAAPHVDPAWVEAAAHVVAGAGERLGHWWLASRKVPISELVELFVEILWRGLARHLPDPSDQPVPA